MLAMGEDTAEEYLRMFGKIQDEVGFDRLEAGVFGAIAATRFFPTEVEIRAHVPLPEGKRIVYDESCKWCGGSGWKSAVQPESQFVPRTVVRCHCRKVM